MKNKFKFMVIALVCVSVLTSCGGGSGSGGVKKNEYFGKLPAIYGDYQAAKKVNEAESYKLAEKGKDKQDFEKVLELAAELQKKKKATGEKMEADARAEIKTLVGKEIPVSYSNALQNSGELFYDVSAKLEADKDNYLIDIALAYTAKTNLDVAVREIGKTDKKYWAYYRLVSTKGSTIRTGFSSDLVKQGSRPLSIDAGTALLKSEWNSSCDLTYMMHEPENYADFAGIEFITESEYNAIPKE